MTNTFQVGVDNIDFMQILKAIRNIARLRMEWLNDSSKSGMLSNRIAPNAKRHIHRFGTDIRSSFHVASTPIREHKIRSSDRRRCREVARRSGGLVWTIRVPLDWMTIKKELVVSEDWVSHMACPHTSSISRLFAFRFLMTLMARSLQMPWPGPPGRGNPLYTSLYPPHPILSPTIIPAEMSNSKFAILGPLWLLWICKGETRCYSYNCDPIGTLTCVIGSVDLLLVEGDMVRSVPCSSHTSLYSILSRTGEEWRMWTSDMERVSTG